MAEQYWAACRTVPGREHIVRAEIEKTERGAFLPTFARSWISDGKISARESVLMPGYVFFKTDAQGWGGVSAIDGVHDVLSYSTADDRHLAKRVSDQDMLRLTLGHATGDYNRIDAPITCELPVRRERKSSRKPRCSNRIRNHRRNTVP